MSTFQTLVTCTFNATYNFLLQSCLVKCNLRSHTLYFVKLYTTACTPTHQLNNDPNL